MDKSFSLLDIFIILLLKKKRILIHFLAATAASIALSYIIPKTYKATTLFLPPFSETPRLSSLSLGLGLNLGGEIAFTPQQIESMLASRKILEQTVHKFELMKIYKTSKQPNRMERALRKLKGNMDVGVVTESGLTQNTVVHFALSVTDKDRNRAADMANFLVKSLNAAMNELSWSQYAYSVGFIKGRLDSVVLQKSEVQRRLAQFQKTNKVYSPEMKEQVLASVATYAELKKQKIMGEIEKNLLMFDREKNNREVLFADKKIKQLDEKMSQIEKSRSPEVLPGLDYSVDIAYDYINMVQETEVLTRLELLLRQQYEETRIKSARQAPEVRVIDKAVPPEWKNFPKKSILVSVFVGIYMTILLISVLVGYGVSQASEGTRRKLAEFREAASFRAG